MLSQGQTELPPLSYAELPQPMVTAEKGMIPEIQ
jgi:hypothetical protein